MDGSALLWLSFIAGIYAPLGSPCVLVLYPGYLSFLAGMKRASGTGPSPFSLGLAVASGAIISLFIGGLLFALALQVLGEVVRTLITPAIYILLLIFSVALLLDIDLLSPVARLPLPRAKTPPGRAFLLGFLLGIIILPCNTAVILFLIVLASSVSGAVEAVSLFLVFGLGMTLPLLLLAGISQYRGQQVVVFLTRHRLVVQRVAGFVLFIIAVYYFLLSLFPGWFF